MFENGNPIVDKPQKFMPGSCHADGLLFYYIAMQKNIKAGDIIHLTFSEYSHKRAVSYLAALYPGSTFNANAPYGRHVLQVFSDFLTGGRRNLPFLASSPFLEQGRDFQKQVWRRIAMIPYGEIRTYGELAGEINKPRSARAVGQACHANPLALIIPCHRVVGAHSLGGFAGSVSLKRRLLERERGFPLPMRCV